MNRYKILSLILIYFTTSVPLRAHDPKVGFLKSGLMVLGRVGPRLNPVLGITSGLFSAFSFAISRESHKLSQKPVTTDTGTLADEFNSLHKNICMERSTLWGAIGFLSAMQSIIFLRGSGLGKCAAAIVAHTK